MSARSQFPWLLWFFCCVVVALVLAILALACAVTL